MVMHSDVVRRAAAPSLLATALLALLLTGCENKGPVERAGEEVDEAVDTLKNGHESTATKLDDAADEVRDGVQDAAKEVQK